MTNNAFGFEGAKVPTSGTSDYNAMSFLVRQMMSQMRTATLVQVKGVTNSGDLGPVGFVDVLPLVDQLDGAGRPVPHGVIYQLPYLRIQGGADAVIIDPKVGDIGMAVFADRDISSVKATRKGSNPGSLRMNDMADGMYLGGFLNGTPSQYIRFSASGIEIYSPQTVRLRAGVAIEMDAPTIRQRAAAITFKGQGGEGTAAIDANGQWNFTGDTFTHNNVNIGDNHRHANSGGSGTGGQPI